MELIVAGVVGGILLALVLAKVIFEVVGGAVDGFLDRAIHTFGNDEAIRRQEARKENEER